MIISKKISFKISIKNFKFYKDKYDIKVGDIIEISGIELKHSCKIDVEVKCDKCGKTHTMKYDSFLRSGNTNEYSLCKTCRMHKNNQEKYGVYNVFQLKSIKEKSKKTIQHKYGCDNVSQNTIVQQKKIDTSIERYGTKHPLQNKKIFAKQIKTIQEKYGVDNISKLDDIKKKKDDTFFNNYDVHSIYKSPITLEKIIKTNNEKYDSGSYKFSYKK